MPWRWGRGWRWWYYATGMPGWMRARYGLPAFGMRWFRGNPYPFCRWFPWLPRWWWAGIYGPVQWTPQGPVLASQSADRSTTPNKPILPAQFQPQMTREQEIQYLEQELKAMEEERKMLEQAVEMIRKRLKRLKSKI